MAYSKKQKYAIEKYGKTVDAKEILEKESFRPHNMRLFRERILGISQKELARRLDVDPQSISDWESVVKDWAVPSPDNLLALCREFGCQPVDLYSDFRAKHLASMLDDMLEMIIADFNQNIRSNRISNKALAMKQFEVLHKMREYQEGRGTDLQRDPASIEKEQEMHKRRYGTGDHNTENEDDE